MAHSNHLTPATVRRLKSLPQLPSVWEGDWQPLGAGMMPMIQSVRGEGICLLWVDGTAGMVRAMDVVPPDTGKEAMVRALLQAMESPQGAPPARPQKIVVRDRELHFYLRGILSDLDIKVEWQPDLPLIDEIYSTFGEESPFDTLLPEPFDTLLPQKAERLWRDAPWRYLADHQLIEIQLNRWDIGSLYVSIMGNLGMEYGILFYRSLDVLIQFRQRVQEKDEEEDMERTMEEAFLQQDCLFVTYDTADEQEFPLIGMLPWDQIEPRFGLIHPLEGLRPSLDNDEAAVMTVALEALHRFISRHRKTLIDGFGACSGTYRIPDPDPTQGRKTITVNVSSLPDIADQLLGPDDDSELNDEDYEGLTVSEGLQVSIKADLIPERSMVALGMLPWDLVELAGLLDQFYRITEAEIPTEGDGFPVLVIRTTRPKAIALIETLKAAGQPDSLCFPLGLDPTHGAQFELEILKMKNGDLHLVGEFRQEDQGHAYAKAKWDRRCQSTGGICGLLVAMGASGSSARSGTLKPNHMMALFEMRCVSPEEMGVDEPMVRLGWD